MNKTKRKTVQAPLHMLLPFLGALLLLVSLSILPLLVSCSSASDGEAPADTAATDNENRDTAETDGTAPQPSDTGTSDRTNEKMLLYYVALVEELQEEVRQLKAENFILSSSKNETEEEIPVGSDPSDDLSSDFVYRNDGGKITILSYVGKDKNPTVPAEIGGFPVTKIGENAFSDSGVVSVSLPDSVTELDWFAFSGCASLRTVTAGASIVSVGYGAFDGCPASLTLICPADSYLSRYGRSFGIAVKPA